MKLSFVPIARRDLKYVSGSRAIDIVLAISAPYRPPRTPTAAGKMAACMIQDCDDPSLALEIGGDDEFEALQLAIIHLEIFIQAFKSERAGKLLNRDGTPFESKKTSFLSHFLAKSIATRTNSTARPRLQRRGKARQGLRPARPRKDRRRKH